MSKIINLCKMESEKINLTNILNLEIDLLSNQKILISALYISHSYNKKLFIENLYELIKKRRNVKNHSHM